MKISVCSDLHLEFGEITLENDQNAEVLVLAGDIFVAQDFHDHPEPEIPYTSEMLKILGSRQKKAAMYRNFLRQVSFDFPHVIVIAGNHEFYHGKWNAALDYLYDECGKFSNVYFMENDCKTIGDNTFIGCTLWTDMNKEDPISMTNIRSAMNDYHVIRNDAKGFSKITPENTIFRHKKSLEYIREKIKDEKQKYVIVGHHAPSTQSIHEIYRDDFIMNGAYANDLSEFILDHPQIKLWIHGHTHHRFDYMIGDTRVFCNPRGYIGYEKSAENFQLQTVEL